MQTLKNYDMIRAMKKKINSDYHVKCTTVQFYDNSYNSQSDHWFRLKFCMSYLGLRVQVNWSSRRQCNTSQQRLYEFCYLLAFDLWTFYLVWILFLQGCGSLFWESPRSTRIFNGLQNSFQVWKRFINVSKFFSYMDSLFIQLQQGNKTSELILPSHQISYCIRGILRVRNLILAYLPS